MLLTITTTHKPATDLGFLLHKNPSRVQSFELSFGAAHVFYPQADENICTAALLLDVDAIGLVRRKNENRPLAQYVNDRPYVASSLLSVAVGQVFRSALAGKCEQRAELCDTEIPLEADVSVLPSRGGADFLRRLFEPLGYQIEIRQLDLDEKFPEWGASQYFSLRLRAKKRLSELLTHLYVLIPVLDNEKHYYVGDEEIEKLLKRGAGWLAAHPERETITRRYLKNRQNLVREALSRLAPEEAAEENERDTKEAPEERLEKPLSLNEQRYAAVINALKTGGAKRVVDVGCGEGKLLRRLLEEREFAEIVGVDVSHRALEIASERLKIERLAERQKERIKLLHGSLTYRDKRLGGFDAATVIEVIEHLDAGRLAAFERVLFEFAKPKTVVLTTPNVEYNRLFETLPAGAFRHPDHRFEWTRAEFQTWAKKTADRFGYAVQFFPIGELNETFGSPTQMAVFTR